VHKKGQSPFISGQTCLKYKQAEWSTASLYTISQLPCNWSASVSATELDGPAHGPLGRAEKFRPIKAFSTSISVQPLKPALPLRPMGRACFFFEFLPWAGPGRKLDGPGRAMKPPLSAPCKRLLRGLARGRVQWPPRPGNNTQGHAAFVASSVDHPTGLFCRVKTEGTM